MEMLSFAVAGLMVGAVALWRTPARECDQCPHCRIQRQEAERRRGEERHRQVHSLYGPHCPICHHDA